MATMCERFPPGRPSVNFPRLKQLPSQKLTFEVDLDAGPENGGVKVGGLARELGLQVAPRQFHR